MPSNPWVRFTGRQRAASVFGDGDRLIAGKRKTRKTKKAKRVAPHRFIYWKVSHARVCSCGKGSCLVNRVQGEAAWHKHLEQVRPGKIGAG